MRGEAIEWLERLEKRAQTHETYWLTPATFYVPLWIADSLEAAVKSNRACLCPSNQFRHQFALERYS